MAKFLTIGNTRYQLVKTCKHSGNRSSNGNGGRGPLTRFRQTRTGHAAKFLYPHARKAVPAAGRKISGAGSAVKRGAVGAGSAVKRGVGKRVRASQSIYGSATQDRKKVFDRGDEGEF